MMSYENKWEKEGIENINLKALTGYLTQKKWKKIKEHGNWQVWQLAENKIRVAVHEEYSDFHACVSRVIEELQNIEERDKLNIIEDILNIKQDVIKIKIKDPSTTRGTVPLKKMIPFFESTNGVIKSSAYTVDEKKAYFANSTKNAKQYIDHSLEFGQTERGSFIVKIISSFEKDPEEDNRLLDEPFERKVLLNLAENVKEANETAEKCFEENNKLAVFDSVKKGLSSNFYTALGEMTNQVSKENVIFSFSWSPFVKGLKELPKKVEVESKYSDFFKEAGELLRESEKEEDVLVCGFVTGLHRDEDEETGEVIVKDKNLKKNVHLTLSEKEGDYDLAVKAHYEKNLFTCKGALKKEGKKNVLKEAYDCKIEEVENREKQPLFKQLDDNS
jgi:hypothetical protein